MDPQAGQHPPPYSAGTSAPYPVKGGGPPMHGGPMQPGYPVQQGYVTTNPGYPHGQPQRVTTTTTVVQQQPPVMINACMFGEVPINMKCTTCHTQIITATEFAPGALSWLACCGLAAVGCVLGCCFIPFCIDEMKDVTHTCPNCKVTLGIYRRI